MAIVSKGYQGSILTQDWAQIAGRFAGAPYSVDGPGDWKVSVAAGDGVLNVAPGTGWGKGVKDVSSAVESVQLPAAASGHEWHVVGAQRNWTATTGVTGTGGKGRTEFTSISAGNSASIPASRDQDGGVLDFQPLYLAKRVAGQTAVQDLIDVRCWSSASGVFAHDGLVRQYLQVPSMKVTIGVKTYQAVINAGTESVSWVKTADFTRTGVHTDSNMYYAWDDPGSYETWWRIGDRVEVRISAVLRGRDIIVGQNGDFANSTIARMAPGFRPTEWWAPLSSGPSGRSANGSIDGEGRIHLTGVGGTAPIRTGDRISLGGSFTVDD